MSSVPSIDTTYGTTGSEPVNRDGSLWAEVVQQTIKDLVPGKDSQRTRDRVRDAYNWLTKPSFAEDRALVFDMAGLETGAALKELQEEIDNAKEYLKNSGVKVD